MKKIILTIIALLCIIGSQANNETLPNAKVGKGMATLKVRMIDCRPEMNCRLKIQDLKLQINGMPEKDIKFDDNGYIEV